MTQPTQTNHSTGALIYAHVRDVCLAPLDGRRRKISNSREMLNSRDYITRDARSYCIYIMHTRVWLQNEFQGTVALNIHHGVIGLCFILSV